MRGIRKSKDGALIDIDVSPNSKREGCRGYDQWRGRFLLSMREKPEKFKVNREIVEFFSNLFSVEKNRVRIIAGEKSTTKTVLIQGVEIERAEEIIGRCLEKG